MKISNGVNYISSACLPFRETFNLLKYGSKNHLYNIELSSNLIHQEDYYSPLKQFQNFNFLIHNYFPAPKLPFVFNLASRNKNILEKSINHCKEAMDLCSFL
ncbi:MAG TPA: endonuclease IV, partial [Candidatus Parcubacteria bacterium]|nr:endonuclease IV [Candidatus Parcubacteria bacterium]